MKFYLKLKVHCTSVSLITGADTTIFLTLKGCVRGTTCTCMSTSFGPRPHGRREMWPGYEDICLQRKIATCYGRATRVDHRGHVLTHAESNCENPYEGAVSKDTTSVIFRHLN